jgi:4-hydroxy-2-oxoheptanedioate aldolase
MRLLLLLLLALAASAQSPRLNRVIELLENGTPPLGIFTSKVSPRDAYDITRSALDFVIIDMEHSPFDTSRLESYMLGLVNRRRILEKGNLQPDVVPIVRIPANGRERSQYQIKQVLDLGAFGVLVPHIDTAADALNAVRAARFGQPAGSPILEPRGQRGVGYGWASQYWGIGDAYPRRADLWPLNPQGELLLWIMIETREGVANIESIARVPGIGGIFLGPGDLSFSMGVAENSPSLEAAMQKVLAVARAHRIPCGTLTYGNDVPRRLGQGFGFLAVGGEGGLSTGIETGLRLGRQFPH